MTSNERCLLIIKPDGVQRGMVGETIKRFEAKGFKLVAIKLMLASKELLDSHYSDLRARPFFSNLVSYLTSGPVVPMVWEGVEVVKSVRVLLGGTGTIHGDSTVKIDRNIIHSSDSVESANKEISLWFEDSELVSWTPTNDCWISLSNEIKLRSQI